MKYNGVGPWNDAVVSLKIEESRMLGPLFRTSPVEYPRITVGMPDQPLYALGIPKRRRIFRCRRVRFVVKTTAARLPSVNS